MEDRMYHRRKGSPHSALAALENKSMYKYNCVLVTEDYTHF
jgi:hypothetical protein